MSASVALRSAYVNGPLPPFIRTMRCIAAFPKRSFSLQSSIATWKMVAAWAKLIFLSRAANGERMGHNGITFVNEYGEGNTIRTGEPDLRC